MKDYLQKFLLKELTVFIVGGSGLIGREICDAVTSAGANTIVLDKVDIPNRKKYYRSSLTWREFDCSNLNSLEKQFLKVIKEFNVPDILINCSYPRTKDWAMNSFKNISLNSFRKNIDIHLNSYAWLAKLTAEEMVNAKKKGNIIQFGSIYGLIGQDLSVYKNTDMHENMTYATIKGGIHNLTRQMASYYGQFNIRVNTICPGGLSGHVAGKTKSQDPHFVKQYIEKTPLKRMGRADEIASATLFLAGEASSYITGATIVVDGGWSIV
jgi:NAD(P)-dependent dehydrogenase (short-subunit alcohol dehydrogenase family)